MKVFKYPAKAERPDATAEERALEEFQAKIHPQVERAEVVKTGQIRKETRSFSNSTNAEVWRYGDVTFTVDSSRPGQIKVRSKGMTPTAVLDDAKEDSDFAELAWVDSGAFQGVQALQGLKCYAYKSGDQMAWVDQTTRLPVLYRSPRMEISYTYKTSPIEPLQLPAEFIKKLEAVKRAWMGR